MKNDSQIAREFVETGVCKSCPVIDMHGHYGPFRGIYLPKPMAEGMIETMDRSGVRCVVCSSHTSLADPERGNREMAEVVRKHPGRFYAYRTVNPNYPEKVKEEVARYDGDEGFAGFKFHPSGHSYPITGKAYVPALEFANERKLLLLTHTWGNSQYDGPSMVEKVAKAYPQITFLMGHSGYGEWDESLRVARENENVYLELTAASRIGGIVTRMVREVGAKKVVFGTDLPWFDPHFGIGSVCFSRITEEDRHDILHRNAERMLGSLLT